MATGVGIQLLGVLLNYRSLCHFSVNNSALCLDRNHHLGERPLSLFVLAFTWYLLFSFVGPSLVRAGHRERNDRVSALMGLTV